MKKEERELAIEIVEADLGRAEHQRAVVELLDAYARDPMGDGRPLAAEVKRALVPGLREHPTTLIFLAYRGADAVGIAVCFRGFSTFAARPLINIHDLAVLPGQRGQGIGRQLLEAVEGKARALGCCKLTLEVQENNAKARRAYAAAGFERAVYQEASGGSLFLWKLLGERGAEGASDASASGEADELAFAVALPNAGLVAMAQSLLEQAGISYFLRNQSAQGVFGLVVAPPAVMVESSRLAEARELLEPLLGENDPVPQSDGRNGGARASESEVDEQPADQD